MRDAGHVVVVGGSLGGLRAAEQLRRQGWRGDLTVVGAEPHPPYNRPPLSKAALRASADDSRITASDVAANHRLPESAGAGISWRLGVAVTRARLDDRTLTLQNGSRLRYDGLVVATGLRPRRLSQEGGEENRHALRTSEDAVRLGRALASSPRVVVVGAGFLGCEIAFTAWTCGCKVDIVEPAVGPMVGVLGQETAGAVRRWQEHHADVRFHLGQSVRAIRADQAGVISAVQLDDDTEIECDLLVEAIGSKPNTEWLADNGLALGDGVLCDPLMRVEGRPEVVAVGDVACQQLPFPHPPVRIEHWAVPTQTARQAARTLTAHLAGTAVPAVSARVPPSFWSDQFGLRISGFGVPGIATKHHVLEGSIDAIADGIVIGAVRGDMLVGVTSIGLPVTALARYQPALYTRSFRPHLIGTS